MRFQHACFISYCHGQHDLVKSFMDQFVKALQDELDVVMDERVYIDVDRLRPGYTYNEELGDAICRSACMIVVYSPKYERHPYCGREYEAMERLEQGRLARLALSGRKPSLIIPVVLRGFENLPPRIAGRRQAVDFSRFTLAVPELARNPEYVGKIREIAEVIQAHCELFDAAGGDPCAVCAEFSMPAESELAPWRPPMAGASGGASGGAAAGTAGGATMGGGMGGGIGGWQPPFVNR